MSLTKIVIVIINGMMQRTMLMVMIQGHIRMVRISLIVGIIYMMKRKNFLLRILTLMV